MIEATSLNTKSYKNLAVFFAIILIIRCRPFYLWDYEDIIRPICAIIVTIIAITNLSKEKWSIPVFILMASSYLWATIIVDRSSIVTVLNFLAFAFIPLIKKELLLDTFDSFRKLYIGVIIISFISYILASLGMPSIGIFSHQNGPETYSYLHYPFLIRGFREVDDPSMRFQSIFDEPGLVGTISGMILIAEKMNLSKKGNLILLICSLFTLSFYFYVALIFGFLFFSKGLEKKRLRYIVLFAAFIYITYEIPYFYDNLWVRFSYDMESGRFVGDNRNGWGLRDFYESIKWTPIFFTGLGSQFAEQYSAAASLFLVIVKHGFIFVVLNLGAYLLLSFREITHKPTWIMFALFFLLTLYQRPGLYDTYAITMNVMLIYKFSD